MCTHMPFPDPQDCWESPSCIGPLLAAIDTVRQCFSGTVVTRRLHCWTLLPILWFLYSYYNLFIVLLSLEGINISWELSTYSRYLEQPCFSVFSNFILGIIIEKGTVGMKKLWRSLYMIHKCQNMHNVILKSVNEKFKNIKIPLFCKWHRNELPPKFLSINL